VNTLKLLHSFLILALCCGGGYAQAATVTGLPKKEVPVAGDKTLIDDSQDGNRTKHVELGDLPISGPVQEALNAKEDNLGFTPLDSALKGAVGGVAELDAEGKVPSTQLPEIPSSYELPTATAEVLGGVKIGDRLTIVDGVVSADVQGGGEGGGIAHGASDGTYWVSYMNEWVNVEDAFGSAALANIGTSIGDVPGIVDGGGGVASLNFGISYNDLLNKPTINGGITLPAGCGFLDLVIVNEAETGIACLPMGEHPTYLALLNAFNSEGFNSFTFNLNTIGQHHNGDNGTYYQSTVPFPISLSVTDSNEDYTVAAVSYNWGGAGYQAMTYSEPSSIWEKSGITGSDGVYTLRFRAEDTKTPTPNAGESSVYAVVIDTTDPVVTDNSTSSNHNGTNSITLNVNVTEQNLLGATYSGNGGNFTGSMNCTGTAPSHNCTATVNPNGFTSDITFVVTATDKGGRSAGSGNLVVAYDVNTSTDYTPATAHFLWGDTSTSGSEVKVCVWSTSNTLLGCSATHTKSLNNVTSTAITGIPELASGDYKLGIILGGWVPLAFEGTGSNWNQVVSANNFAVPTDHGSLLDDAPVRFAIWLTNSSGDVILGDNNTATKTSKDMSWHETNTAYSEVFPRRTL